MYRAVRAGDRRDGADLSAINAVTLKPTQCALWLRPSVPMEKRNAFYRGFNAAYLKLEGVYARLMHRLVGVAGIMVIVALVGIGFTLFEFSRIATGFIPIEDQGYMLATVQLPDGASLPRTQAVLDKVGELAGKTRGRRQGHHHRRRVAARQQRLARQCRRRLHHPQGLGRARQGAGPVADAQQPQRGDGADRGRDRARAAAAADPGHRLRRRLHHATRAARQQPRLQRSSPPSPAASSPMRRRSRASPWCCRRSDRTRRNTRSTSTG